MKFIAIILAMLFDLLVSAKIHCQTPKIFLTGETQGTYYAITYFDKKNRDMQDEVDSIFRLVDNSVSQWNANSLINRINNNETNVFPDEFFINNFKLAMEVSDNTDGYFDITIGPLVSLWGFGLKKRIHVTPEMVVEKSKLVDYCKVQLLNGKIIKEDTAMRIDFNAIAQGYTVDVLASMLMKAGIDRFIIDVGGEIYANRTKPDGSRWSVGIEQPSVDKESQRNIQQRVRLKNKGLATSGSYRNYFEENGKRFAHVIDPKTGYPVNHNLLSVTVLADNTAVADAYCTAFLAMGIEKSLRVIEKVHGLEALFISGKDSTDFEIFVTKGFRKIMVE
ncbi:MAG: FAD:protein FMN transferase [Bacteroidales bacterium]|nr:FAD:protein FMN transferase [Bacteroidales bacterium]